VSAVWTAAWAAIRRRKLQTIVIGFVVWVSTVTLVVALGLLAGSSAPFDHAYEQQRGAHVVTVFDGTKTSETRLAQTATTPGVDASAGPFGQVALDASRGTIGFPGMLTTVGRADPGGAVDRLNVWEGRWVAGPGEIVLNGTPGTSGPLGVGTKITFVGQPALTVVGFAYSVSESAGAWVTPEQMTALRPTAVQMLYRFTHAANAAEVDAAQARVTAGLPLLGSQSYLAVKERVTSGPGVYVPFLVVFGILGLAVAVLIVANIVSGAVVAGFRHIGVLKAIGFTPPQVMAVYLLMVSMPAVIGCVLGTALGGVLAQPLLTDAFEGFGAVDVGVPLWVYVAALLGMPALVVVAALVPALRARSLSASEAISAGSAPHSGRGLRIQRWLGGTRLPRSLSLGLGLPFARPARSALTMSALVLGVMSVTLASGLTMSVVAYRDAVNPPTTDQVQVMAGGRGPVPSPDGPVQDTSPEPTLSDAEDEALLRSRPDTVAVVGIAQQPVQIAGAQEGVQVSFYRGDSDALAPNLLSGHWPDGPGQVAVPSRFLNQRGYQVGDTITLELEGKRVPVEIVGNVLANSPGEIFSNWETLRLLAPGARAVSYQVQLKPGSDAQAYAEAVRAGDPGLRVFPAQDGSSSMAAVIIGSATLLTLLLAAVAALGVFNTVVLNTRERRRDLGMLKSIGMTPRQVTVMMVTSMGVLGVLGGLVGLPLGVEVHGLVAPAMLEAGQADIAESMVDVYHLPALVLLALTGIPIAVLGALLPSRRAARLTVAEVLHNE
jgi:putative ABC transport system permease protein